MNINKNKSLIDSKQNNGDNSTSFLMKWEQWEHFSSLFGQWFLYITKIFKFEYKIFIIEGISLFSLGRH